MKKSALLLGSSLLGMALLTSSAAVAADDVAVEGAAPAAGAPAAPGATPDLPRGLYAGGSLGVAMWEPDKTSTLWSDNFTVDDVSGGDDFMWTVFGGYRMTDWLGFEVGWTNLGGFHATDQLTETDFNKTGLTVDGVETRLRFWHNLGMDRLGIKGLTAIGGIGAYFYSSHTDTGCYVGGIRVDCPYDPATQKHHVQPVNGKNDSGESFTASLGLQYQITDNVLIRTEYQRYFAVDRQNIDTVTASVVVGFYDIFGQGKPRSGEDLGGIVVE